MNSFAMKINALGQQADECELNALNDGISSRSREWWQQQAHEIRSKQFSYLAAAQYLEMIEDRRRVRRMGAAFLVCVIFWCIFFWTVSDFAAICATIQSWIL